MSVLSDLASGATGGLLGGVGQLVKDVREAWTGEIPADKRAEFAAKMAEIEAQTMNAQAMINLEEAKSEKFWVSGWRPFIGWICGTSLGYAAIMRPLIVDISLMNGAKWTVPILDTTITLQVLLAILGVGIMRSYDKKQDPEPKGKE